MGVPSYFNYILQKYKYETIIKNKPPFEPKYLFFDLNCAIHPVVKKNPTYTIDEMYKEIIIYINIIIDYVKPTDNIYLIIDGVAPRAKMEQQRNRRYKSILYKEKQKKIYEKYKQKIDLIHDYNMISPGTDFMNNLSIYLKKTYEKNPLIIISDSNDPGEGEHKIFNYIRNSDFDRVIIYGLDADLIFLSLINYKYVKNIMLIRESLLMSNELNSEKSPFLYLDIDLLYEKLVIELSGDCINSNVIIDYVFISFFLGNDFLPNIPSLHIKEGSIDHLIEIYKTIKTELNNETLIIMVENNIDINLKFLKKLYNELIKIENELLIHYSNKKDQRITSMKKKFKYMKPLEREIEELNYIEWIKPDIINYSDSDWKKRYNKYYFNKKNPKKIADEYFNGMKWILLYYLGLNTNNNWYYPYYVAPSISDFQLKKFNNIENNSSLIISPLLQLIYILPFESIHLLPEEIRKIIEKRDLNFHIYYPTEVKIDTMNRKYFNDSLIYLPNIDLEYLYYLFKPLLGP